MKNITDKKLLKAAVVFGIVIIVLVPAITLGLANPIPTILEVSPGDNIQSVIDNATEGDTILLLNGQHILPVDGLLIDKRIVLMGQDREHTVLLFQGSTGILLFGNNAQISRLTLDGAFAFGFEENGILMCGNSNMINNIIVRRCAVGITFWDGGCFNTIRDNLITENGCGIYMYQDEQALTTPCGNMVYKNRFINNNNHVVDETIAADYYDNGHTGNYWDDIEGNSGYPNHMYYIYGNGLTGIDHYPDWNFPHDGKEPCVLPVFFL